MKHQHPLPAPLDRFTQNKYQEAVTSSHKLLCLKAGMGSLWASGEPDKLMARGEVDVKVRHQCMHVVVAGRHKSEWHLQDHHA